MQNVTQPNKMSVPGLLGKYVENDLGNMWIGFSFSTKNITHLRNIISLFNFLSWIPIASNISGVAQVIFFGYFRYFFVTKSIPDFMDVQGSVQTAELMKYFKIDYYEAKEKENKFLKRLGLFPNSNCHYDNEKVKKRANKEFEIVDMETYKKIKRFFDLQIMNGVIGMYGFRYLFFLLDVVMTLYRIVNGSFIEIARYDEQDQNFN